LRTDAGERRVDRIRKIPQVRLILLEYSDIFGKLCFNHVFVMCRTALFEGHTNIITASDITPDRKHLATVSLDFMLKVSLKQIHLNFYLFC